MEAHEEKLLALLREQGSLGNAKARELLGVDQPVYEQLRNRLMAQGILTLAIHGIDFNFGKEPANGFTNEAPVPGSNAAGSGFPSKSSRRRRRSGLSGPILHAKCGTRVLF